MLHRLHHYVSASLLCAALVAPTWAAQEFCVDTVSEFNAAYDAADEENVIIRVEQGSYDMTNSCVDAAAACDIDDDVTIIGGYNNGCTSRSGNAALTVFTRPGGGLKLSTSGSAFAGNGDLSLRGVTFRAIPNGVRILTENGNGLNPDASVKFNQVWFDRTAVAIALTADVFIRNSLFNGASTGCALKIEANANDEDFLDFVQLVHVTVANNQGAGICIGQPDSARFTLEMVNTIAWGNSTDVMLDSGASGIDISFLNNTYETIVTGRALIGQNIGRLTSDPQFVSPASNDFELGGNSTSINSSFPLGSVETDKDLKGDNRRFSTAADRGALESAVGSTATTLLVTTTADSGLGSLRQAISDANLSPNLNRIHFDIGASCGPRLISLQSPLPQILGSLVIDGYTQTGAVRNTEATGNNGTLCIVLQQPSGSFANSALVVTAAADPSVSLRVDGIGFSNFLLGAVLLGGGNGHAVVGSQFGGDVGTIDLLPSGYGVQTGAGMRGVSIGGPDPEDRNTFTEAVIAGISIAAASAGEFSDAVIENNYIGLTRSGFSAQGNDKGIIIRGAGNRVLRNTISSNAQAGIELTGASATDNIIEYNRIGRTASFCILGCERGNGEQGIWIHNDATRNQIRYNDIWYNQSDGINVVGAELNPIYQNDLFDNTGEPIDLGSNGRTLNDNDSAALPTDAGNRNQNFPVLTLAQGGDVRGVASGTLSSINAWFRIDFYAADGCPAPFPVTTAEGRYHLGSTMLQITNATNGVDGTASFSNAVIERQNDADFFVAARGIIATATRYSANPFAGGKRLHTSEFSSCRTYVNNGALFQSGFE
jgi:trimeric autotransporter adhesin